MRSVHQSGIKPAPPALEAWSLKHKTAREILALLFSFLYVKCLGFRKVNDIGKHHSSITTVGNLRCYKPFSWCLYSITWAFFFLFPFGHVACRILVPRPGNKLVPSALEVQNINHWMSRHVPVLPFMLRVPYLWDLFSLWNRKWNHLLTMTGMVLG